MSEVIINKAERLPALTDFARRLINGENGKLLIEKFSEQISRVTPMEVMMIFDNLLVNEFPLPVVKANTGKIINVFYRSLSSFHWDKPGEGHFLFHLMAENRGAEEIMTGMKSVIKLLFHSEAEDPTELVLQLMSLLERLKNYELHYLKKENILFPYLERVFPQYHCLQLMWSFHDDFRSSIKILKDILNSNPLNREDLNKELGTLFFTVYPVIFREEQIIFPVALKAIGEDGWSDMMDQSLVTGWCYISEPGKKKKTGHSAFNPASEINLETGFLTPLQLIGMLNTLPFEITFVDASDEVRYFSGGDHQIFTRSKAIIGRKVQNCHPHESVHIVNEILESFKSGKKDHADFWINIKDRFIYIRYFAVRGEDGEYVGTIEVTQDGTELRSLKGERRLLEWDKKQK